MTPGRPLGPQVIRVTPCRVGMPVFVVASAEEGVVDPAPGQVCVCGQHVWEDDAAPMEGL